MRRTCRHGNTGSEDLAQVIDRRYLHNNAVADLSRCTLDDWPLLPIPLGIMVSDLTMHHITDLPTSENTKL